MPSVIDGKSIHGPVDEVHIMLHIMHQRTLVTIHLRLFGEVFYFQKYP